MIKNLINTLAERLHIKRRMFINPMGGKKSISISYAITVCNEAAQLHELLEFLHSYCVEGDEIVVQADKANVTDAVKLVIQAYPDIHYTEYDFHFDFAQAKNHLTEQCHGEWIFQLDADECPQVELMKHLRAILHANYNTELVKIPRINVFVNKDGNIIDSHVAWPDYQGRIYRNLPNRICWQFPLHEKIHGHKAYVYLPKDDQYAIRHLKEKEQDKEKWQNWKKHYT